MLKIVLVFCVAILSTLLFKKASGTLSPQNINAISYAYYLLLITCLAGGSITFLGFRDHYVLRLIRDDTASKGYFIIAYSVIALPFFIAIFNRMMGIRDYNTFYKNYINKDINLNGANEKSIFTITVIVTVVCILAIAYTFYHVGYIALIELLKGKFYLMNSSVSVNRQFTGNVYIRNIFALGFTPILSYFTYIFYRFTQKKSWKVLFYILLILSILVKTYDFSKAPIVIYFMYFYLIKVMIGDIHNIKVFIGFGSIATVIILIIYYSVLGYSGSLLSFTNGPVSRLMVSQIAGLFMHVQIFPNSHPFLKGASFPKTIAALFGANDYGVRSGRVIMSTLYPASVADNTAGVMNTLFAGEAYANYGMVGVLIAPIIVAFCLSVIPNFILKQEKNPFAISIYMLYTYCYEQALIGGFVDYIYNVLLIVLLIMIIMMHAIVQRGIIRIRIR